MDQKASRYDGDEPATAAAPRTSGAPVSSNEIASPHLSQAVKSMYSALSPKEHAVALAAALGTEDKEIASELACTLSTVRTLWQRIYRKTRTTSKRRLISTIWSEACRTASSGRVIF